MAEHKHAAEKTVDMVLVYVPIMALVSLAIVLLIFRVWTDILKRRRLILAFRHPCQDASLQVNALKARLNSHLVYAPLSGKRHNREFRIFRRGIHIGTIPSRIQTIFIFSYVALNVVFCVITVDWSKGLSTSMHKLRDKTGTLAVVNLIPLVVTAGRNNPLIPLLRISFDTFNLVHRWLGRTVVIEAIAHTVAVLVGVALRKGWHAVPHTMFHVPLFICGFVATIGFVLIFFQSLAPFRHAFYEFFLHTHIVLVAASFAGLWYHLYHLMHRWIFFAAVAAWGLDRFLRLAIVIWRNCGRRLTSATIQILPGDVARVDVSMVRPWKFKPGQYMYMYIYIPALGLWTSHPFSAAWTSVEKSDSFHSDYSEKKSTTSLKSLLRGGKTGSTTISCLIRRRGGFTKNMMKSVRTAQGGKVRVLALAEGPFGGIHSFDSYGTTLLIAGGIGITHPISHLRELLNGFVNRSVATRRISLLWVVRSVDHLRWIQPWMTYVLTHPALQTSMTFSNSEGHRAADDFYSAAADDMCFQPQTLSLCVHIHITTYYSSSSDLSLSSLDEGATEYEALYTESFPALSPSPSSSPPTLVPVPLVPGCSGSTSTSPSPSPSLSSLAAAHQSSRDWTQIGTAPVTISLGKPLFRQMLEREMAQQTGAMAVSVCGPGGMSDEVRKVVRDVQGSRKTVDFYEEAFS